MPIALLNGVRHYYRLEGAPTKPPLMLVHPVGADLSLWDKVVPTLTKHFQVLRYDLRGHGGSDCPSGEYSIAQLAGELLAMADAIGWKQFAVCGVSIGAMTSVMAAAQAPERITNLVVCSAAPAMGQPPGGGWDGRAKDARTQGMAATADGMVGRMFSATHRATGDALIDTLRLVYVQTNVEGYANSLAVLRDTDLKPLLGEVKAKTLVITGKEDPLVPPAAAEALLTGISGATHTILPGGHFPPVEQAEKFSETVWKFLLPTA